MAYATTLRRYPNSPSGRAKSRYLLIRYEYCHGDPQYGLSNEEHMVAGPLKSAGVADVVEYFFDPGGRRSAFRDGELVDLVSRAQPDLMVLSSYDCTDIAHPSFQVLKAVRQKCGIPLIVIWPDTTGEIARRQCAQMVNHVDLNVLLDSDVLAGHFTGRNNFLRLWAPLDYSVFHPGDSQDIPVSFVGSTGHYRDIRRKFLDYLKVQGINVFWSGGQAEQRMDLAKYAEVIRRSKISLNFSQSVGNENQLKARVFEILFSRSLLLENRNSETSRALTPMVDYVEFDSEEDLRDKVRYFLAHEDERKEIANNGYVKATQQFNHKVFWDKILDKLRALGVQRHAMYGTEPSRPPRQ